MTACFLNIPIANWAFCIQATLFHPRWCCYCPLPIPWLSYLCSEEKNEMCRFKCRRVQPHRREWSSILPKRVFSNPCNWEAWRMSYPATLVTLQSDPSLFFSGDGSTLAHFCSPAINLSCLLFIPHNVSLSFFSKGNFEVDRVKWWAINGQRSIEITPCESLTQRHRKAKEGPLWLSIPSHV